MGQVKPVSVHISPKPDEKTHTLISIYKIKFVLQYSSKYLKIKGLIIPGHILLSDKNQSGNVTKTHEGALLPRVFWSHFREEF